VGSLRVCDRGRGAASGECLRVAAGKAGYGTKRLRPNTGLGIAVTAGRNGKARPGWQASQKSPSIRRPASSASTG